MNENPLKKVVKRTIEGKLKKNKLNDDFLNSFKDFNFHFKKIIFLLRDLRFLVPFSCEAVFFIDNGLELYGFACAVILLWRTGIGGWFLCFAAFDSLGQVSLSELKLSASPAAAASFTKQIWRFLPVSIRNSALIFCDLEL